jgi:hypothetical protein
MSGHRGRPVQIEPAAARHRVGARRSPRQLRRSLRPETKLRALVGLLFAAACSEPKGVQIEQAPNALKGPPLDAPGPKWTRVAPRLLREPEAVADDPSLRRAYGPPDMKLGDCTKRAADGTLRGSGCPNGCVVFGPYVSAPGNSDVHFRFDLRAVDELTVASDMVSNAKLIHGALDPVSLAAGETRRVGYRVHLSQPVQSFEARVFVSADKPVGFEISNLSMDVQ